MTKMMKKIERKSYERKMKLKRCRCQESSLEEKTQKEQTKLEKKKVLSVKLILNGDDQLNISESKVEKKRKVLEDNNVDLKTRLNDGDELLVESEDEKDHPDRDKYLKPIDVNLSCDDVIDTIENDSDNNVEYHRTKLDLNDSDELSSIQEFLEETEFGGKVIDDITSGVMHDNKPWQMRENKDRPATASSVSGITDMDEMLAENTSQVQLDGCEMERPSELRHFYGVVRDTVSLEQGTTRHKEGPGVQLRISDETQLAEVGAE